MANMTVNVDDFVSALDKVDAQGLGDDAGALLRVTEAAKRLVARLQSPFMQMFYASAVPMQVTAALRVISDIGLWEAWREAGGKEATLPELWDMCKTPCDLVLLRRLLLPVAANDFLLETGQDRWRPTPVSLALGDKDSPTYNALIAAETQIVPSAQNLPKFLARTGYEEPTNPLDTNYMDLTPERLDFFARMTSDPELNKSFAGFMQGFAESRLDWTEIFDTNELLDGFDFGNPDNKLLVDIGGSHGLDLTRMLARKPDMPAGFLVLQDLPEIIANTKISEKITLMPHDFFKAQPIIGSRAYLLRAVLHDWDDVDARRILKRIAAAMKKGYSKLLVCDVNLPPKGAQRYQSISDFTMLHLCSSSDRTEKKWTNLLRGANFDLVKIWRHPVSPDCIFEAELAGSAVKQTVEDEDDEGAAGAGSASA